MNEPGLLATVTIGVNVNVDPGSLRRAIRDVEKAFEGIKIKQPKIPAPDFRATESSLEKYSSHFGSTSAQINRIVNSTAEAIDNLNKAVSGLPSGKLVVPEVTPIPPGRQPGEKEYAMGSTPIPPGEAAKQLTEAYVALDVDAITSGARQAREAIERGATAVDEAIRTTALTVPMLGQASLDSAKAVESGASTFAQGISQVGAAIADGAASVKTAADSAFSAVERSATAAAQVTTDAGKQLSDAAEAVGGGASDLGEGAKKVSSATESLRRLPLHQISDIITAALSQMDIEVPASIVKDAAELIKRGTLTFNQALDALRVGFTEPAKVLEAIGEAAGTTVNDLNSAKAAFAGLNAEQFSKVAKQLSVATNAVALAFSAASTKLSSVTKSGIAPKTTDIKRALDFALASAGVTVGSAAKQFAAMYIKQGIVSFDEAVEALVHGSKNASRVIRELAGSSSEAAKKMAIAARQLYGIGPPPSPPGGGPPTAVAGATPQQNLQLAGAMDSASEAGKSLMQVLMALRWKLFTLLFFLYGAIKIFKGLSNAAIESATTIDRVSSAVTVLRARGVRDVDLLIAKLVEASGYFLTTEAAARKLSRVAIIGLPPELIETLPRLMEVARAIALVSDEYGSAEDVFDRFVDAIARAQMRAATTTGAVSGTMEDALSRFRQFVPAMKQMAASGAELPPELMKITKLLIDSGAATATSVAALSEYQKSLLITWSILANGEQVLGALNSEFDKNITQIQELSYTTRELWKSVGIAITQALGIPKFTASISERIRSSIGGLAMTIDQLFAPERYARRWEEAARRADEIISQMSEEERQKLMRQAELEVTIRAVPPGVVPEPFAKPVPPEMLQEVARETLAAQIYAGIVAFEIQAQAAKEADSSLVDYLDSLRKVLGTSEDTARATEELSISLSGLQSAATQFASVYTDYLRAIEDAEIEHQRWYEDLMRGYHQKLADLETELNKSRAKEHADSNKRRQDAAEQLARRLWEIEQNLASRLLSIWRDYNDEMFMAELDRDALRAFLAARRRDRQVAEAHEMADRERQEAHMRYQEQLNEIKEAFNRRIAEIDERMRDERDRIQRWLESELEDRARYEARQTEDRERQYERRYADLLRSLMLEFELQQVMNDKSISEEERFMRMMSAIFTAYNATFAGDARNTYAALRSGAQSYFDWLWYIFRTYYERMLQFRSTMLPLLTAPITPGVRGVGNAPGASGQRPRRYASGGAEIVTTPTHFIAGEAGPELVVAIPMRGINANLHHSFNAVINTNADRIAGRIDAAVVRTLERVLQQVM